MADVNIGTITARLTADSSEFTRNITLATQALAQFQQQVQTQAGQVAQGMQRAAQGTQQLQQQLTQLNQQAISQTGFLGQIAANLTQVQTAAQQTTPALQTLGQAAQQSTSTFQSFQAGVLQVAGGLGLVTSIQGMVGALRDFATSTIEVGTRLETLRISFANIFGGQAGGAAVFGQITQLAQRYGVEITGLATNYQRFAAAIRGTSLEGERGAKVFQDFVIGLRGFGATSAQADGVLNALVQTLQKGTVSAEEIRRQMGQVIPATAELAKGLGVTTEALEGMLKSGLAAGSSMEALGRTLRQDFGAAADQAAKTAGVAFQQFRNEVTLTQAVLAEKMLPTLAAMARASTDWLKTVREGLQETQKLAGIRTQEALVGTGLRPDDLSRMTDEQRRRFETLNRLIAEQRTAQATGAAPMFQPTREEYIKQLEAERAAILETVQLEKDKAGAKAVAANAQERETAAAQRQVEFEKQIDTILKEVAQSRERFRQAAALQPEVLGRPTGTPEQVQLFLREQQKVLQEPLEKLREAITGARGVAPTAEQMAQVRQLSQEYGRLGDAITSSREAEQARQKAAREAEQEAKRLEREAEQAARREVEQMRQIEREREQAIEQLRRLAGQYTGVKEVRDQDRASELAASLATSQYAEEAQRLQQAIEGVAQVEAQLPRLRAEAAASARAGMAAMETARATEGFTQRIQEQLDLAAQSREERPETRLRARAAREGVTLTEDQENMLRRLTQVRREQEQLHETVRLFEEAAGAVGNAWGQALTSIADGTKTVSEAFRDMARSILQSLAQIASQEAFKALIRLGVGLITGSMGAGGGGGTVSAVGALGGEFAMAQGGAIVNRPTHILAGEGPPHTLPEYILNQPQMASLMSSAIRSGPSAGGQAAGGQGISIINVSSPAQAEQERVRQEAMGRKTVVNYVMQDLASGESSQLNRMIRTLQR